MHYFGRLVLMLATLLCGAIPGKTRENTRTATVTVTMGRPVNTFVPSQALGAGVDGLEQGGIERTYRPGNIRAMRSAGFGPLAYRLRTELGIEAWHWNPAGRWTDTEHRRGYWVSDAASPNPIRISNGYNLPRRGNSIDQANNHGYSRLDDGDTVTFWKSNPYLASYFTHEPDALHPQWIVMDFGRQVTLDTIRIVWGALFATRYRCEWWVGETAGPFCDGDWKPFPLGMVTHGQGGAETIRLCKTPMRVRYVRVLLQQAAKLPYAGLGDAREGLGYAVREVYAGTQNAQGRLHDIIRHGRDKNSQTRMYVSSTDSWHRAEDRDKDVEQPGFDRLFKTGLTNGLPVLIPVGLLYDTPENAVAEIRYLKAKGVPLTQIELGEEPDGQYIVPEDYGALYIQWADAIHAVAPELQLGGPGFQTDIHGWKCWPDQDGDDSWMSRFLRYLKRRNRLKDFRFFSFEWYPFDDLGVPPALQVARHQTIFRNTLRSLEEDGVPRSIPWIITEYGYSSYAGQGEVEMPGALVNAETVAEFLTQGGKAAYLYGYEPRPLIQEGFPSWGNLTLFLEKDNGTIRCPLPCYYGAKLLTQAWAQPGNGLHEVFAAACDLPCAAGQSQVTAFATHRPDGQWAVLLLNKDPNLPCGIRIQFRDPQTKRVCAFQSTVQVTQYGSEQYRWQPNGEDGHPSRNAPPTVSVVSAATQTFRLPAYSLTVVRGTL